MNPKNAKYHDGIEEKLENMKKTFVQMVSVGIVAVGVFAFISCSPKHIKVSGVQTPPAAVAVSTPTVAASTMTEASLRGGEFEKVPQLVSVYFNYDSAKLSSSTRGILKKNARYLKNHPDLDISVTGNCDQRGTVEFNLALGQRRAKSVRSYYMLLGISGHRIATISYGKEKLVCSEMTESCWAKNRHADTLVREKIAAQSASSLTPASSSTTAPIPAPAAAPAAGQ